VLQKGPGGHRLNSSHGARDTDGYKEELGNAIVNFARVVPDGMLVIFPSYHVMNICIDRWQAAGSPSIWCGGASV
jgi:regulator of telomere elongation helicase 1